MADTKKQIGELNGVWEKGFKFAIITYPIVLTALLSYMSWATISIVENKSFRQYAYTLEMANNSMDHHYQTYHKGLINRDEWKVVIDWLKRIENNQNNP